MCVFKSSDLNIIETQIVLILFQRYRYYDHRKHALIVCNDFSKMCYLYFLCTEKNTVPYLFKYYSTMNTPLKPFHLT